MREEDLLRFVWVADPQFSPDGSRIAFTKVWVDAEADDYRSCLMVVDARGGEPRPLTFGPCDTQARWSPDGDRIAFVRGEPKKPGQLCVLPMAGGEPERLTSLAKGASSPAWSPDGRRLALLSETNPALDTDEAERVKPKNEQARVVTRPEFRLDNEGFTDFDHRPQVWVIDAAGGPPRQLTRGLFAADQPAWSRDGTRILFLSDRRREPWNEPEDADVYAVDPDLSEATEGDRLETVADASGPILAFHEGADGRFAAAATPLRDPPRSYDQPRLLLFEGPRPARPGRDLAPAVDFEFGSVYMAADQHPPRGGGAMPLAFVDGGAAVVTVLGKHGAARLARVGVAGGAVAELTAGEREVVGGSVSPDGRRVALVLGSVARPGVLAVYDLERRELRELWDPNAVLLAERPMGEVEEFWLTAADGLRIQGWIVKPPNFDPARRYPLVLQIHGGPHVAYGVGFFHEFRVLAAAGYVVLYLNPRGSTTYGQEFGNVIQYRYPGDDHHDLMAAVDEVVRRGYVDPERIGVTGGSGGGLLTNWAITQTDRFRAAVTQRCVADWASMYYSSDFTLFRPTWFHRPPFEDPDEYRQRSPVAFATKIRTPLLVLHSETDWRTPIGQGETMFRALKQQGKPAAMVRFPGEGHELSRSGAPSRRVDNQRHIRTWFDKWLQGKDAPQYDG
jgi:dipeptidyl aminopeptidase/acylaminoacyl peptidase